jgi:hypothetical protein
MRRKMFLSLLTMSAFLVAALLGGCGSAKKEGAADVLASATKVGSNQCINVCHFNTVDVTGNPIVATWQATAHTAVVGVQCEDCHGGGSQHWGVGPMPFPNPPPSQCAQAGCHATIAGSTGSALTEFTETRHGNSNGIPDRNFSQIPTPVSAGKHIEECSRCHNVNQRFEFDFAGNLVKPSLSNPPAPMVSCAACHDGHQPLPQQMAVVPQRSAPVGYPLFRKYFVDPATGQQVNAGTAGAQNQAGFIFQPTWAVQPDGSVNFTQVQATPRTSELAPDMLCAACHTKGTYKNSGLVTHQDDIHTQWAGSGHGDRNAPAFAEFSADPPAYIDESTGLPFTVGSHRTAYPFDMALARVASTVTPGSVNSTRNGGSNNFACFKCHNGITSIDHQDDVQGSPAAHVVFGDATVTCITCHDAHRNAQGNQKNTRRPLVMTRYSSPIVTTVAPIVTVGSLKFGDRTHNVFLDNTAAPAGTGNETICVFCHQGRESGFTLFKLRLAADNTLPGSFLNDHYLGTGAMLWGVNAYEYSGKQYGAVAEHQRANCNACHMAQSGRNDLGGHSWRIFAESDGAVNNSSCNVAACHNGRVPATKAALDKFRDTVFDPTNDYDGDGVVEGIPEEIRDLAIQLRDLLQANGVFYSDVAYPYFFTSAALTTQFSAWTLPTLKAAFNLNYIIKGLPSQATTQVGQPNPSAATHNFRYNIQILRDSYDELQKKGVAGQPDRSGQSRPAGTRPAVNYDPQADGSYNPRQ